MPEEGTSRTLSAPTVVPPFDPDEFARQSESMIVAADPTERATVPPEPFYTELRDSLSSAGLLAAPRVPATEDAPEIWQIEQSGTRVIPELPLIDARVALAVAREDLEWFELAADALAIAQAADGVASIGEIAGACDLAPELARRICRELAEEGVVEIR